ncbi:FYN-binding protein 1 isoform X2 [Festucalex cinctus]
MENKADVKAIMARFQANAGATDESSSPSPKHKAPVNVTLSSGPAIPSKKPVLESLSGGTFNLPPKPSSYLKSTTKNDTDALGVHKTKALASRFNNTPDETTNAKPLFDRGQKPLKPPEAKSPEVKNPELKPTLKPPLSTTLSNPKPPGPKPPPAGSKPSWVKEESGGGSPTDPTPPKVPPLHRKPNSSIVKLRQQSDTNGDKPPLSNFTAAQETFNKPESDLSADVDAKPPLSANPVAPPPKPPSSKKPSLRIAPKASIPSTNTNSDSTSDLKRNPLPNTLTLGPAPAKPKRPPKVDLDDFRKAAGIFNGNNTFNKKLPPTPSASGNLGNHSNRPQPPQSAVPSLPPRPLGTIVHQEESYDDVDAPVPPPLPPSTGHPSLRPKEEHDSDSGDMYEPLDDAWDEHEKRKEKEEKRQLEAEKKEQKGREKKEQDARKKFKLVGPVEVIQQGKARVDCRGSKTELALKRGDCLDIIRVQGNPEGKWLGRKQDGAIGYVKTTSVEIDFNTLKTRQVAQQGSRCDVYDDVDVGSSDSSGISGQGVFLPPPPEEDDELYNDVIDPDLDVRLPPPSQFTAEENAVDDELYYDVDTQSQPPPPPISSIPSLSVRGKAEETDPKKTKKFEKEEKDFRKKFKYDGEIQVLYQVTIRPAVVSKKWGGKELAVKAGEKLDVIVKPVDNKMICRNEDGKFGYVSTCHICMDDGDIYDDIGDDCIYDNE